jgi:hypothetical protein
MIHRGVAVTDRLVRLTTALAVAAVAGVAAIISYQHAYELVRSRGESGTTARLLPFTVDGLIWDASMAVPDASRRNQHVPPLGAWGLAAGIAATIGANLAHGLGHGPAGVLVSAWPAVALVGSFELLMLLIRSAHQPRAERFSEAAADLPVPVARQGVPPSGAFLEQTVRAWHTAATATDASAASRMWRPGEEYDDPGRRPVRGMCVLGTALSV